ncbi:MAG TPA: hypothetical protein VFL47_13080, partial [Flavisolibacter sp.]|nr:hypothetical protein [Flavisolibacter sp.]
VINKKSTAMFKPVLSAINQAGGGVAFGFGGVTPVHFQTGGMATGATNQAFNAAQQASQIQNIVESTVANMPPIVVTVEDINAKQDEVSSIQQKAQVI